ncbi:MAG TPA: ABC transporter substrate-binding protein [Thermomicrobiales bacterium]|nr:ABC transporter substrate-binding protein [Thermomicrobiales bacterium]
MSHATPALERLIADFRAGKLNRRQLVQRAAMAGIGASALAGALSATSSPGVVYAAQDSGDLKLVTASDEQQSTWTRNFNPLMPQASTSRWPTQNGIYEPMAVFNTPKAELVPWLAESWEFDSTNTVLTFKIRQNVKWSDGTPFTANDVAFTFNLFAKFDGLAGNGARNVMPYLASVHAADDSTVVFRFGPGPSDSAASPAASPAADASPSASPVAGAKPFTVGIYDICGQNIVPEHIWKDVADPVTFTNENPVGTGPFTNVARFENQIWELHKNENYWQEGKPYIDGLRIPAYNSNDAINLATINGENDWAANFIPDIQKTFVDKDPDHFGYWFPAYGATVHLYLNTTVAPFDQVDVRKAISMALNRDQIVTVAMYDYTHPADATGLSDAYESWKDAEIAKADWVTYNVDKANEMLDAAGLTKDGDVRKTPDGKAMEYELNVVSGWSDWVQSCDIISKNLAEVGIKATVKPYEQATWQTNVQNGDFTMSIGWSAGGATPFNFYRGVMSSVTWNPIGTSSPENWHRFKSEEADAALNAFGESSDPAVQKEQAVKLQQLYSDNAPAVPLFPGPQWGEYNTTRFTGFPNEKDPYTILSTYAAERLILLTTIKPV